MLSLRRQSGVTLPELLVTMLVIAILAGVALPNLTGMIATNKLNNAQENVIQVLKKAHTKAVANGTFVTVTISSANKSLHVAYQNGNTSPPDIILDNEIVIGADVTFTFSPNGTVNAGTVQLTSANHSGLAGRGISISVTGLITATR